jgi:DNA-3-methyladenine glycosylase I
MRDAGIVRNRLKIASTISNARAFLEVRREFGTFDAYVWAFVGGRPVQNRRRSMKEVPARSDVSDALSKDLKRRGFRFVGSTIIYAFMQAVGMVNDHLTTCFRRSQIAKLPSRTSSATLRRR